MRTKTSNDLYYTCSLIEYIGRITKNKRSDVIDVLGEATVRHIFEYADVFHCEPIAKVADEFIEEFSITEGQFDNITSCNYRVPDYWELGAVYRRLIEKVGDGDPITTLIEVYHSWLSEYIDDYNMAVYYMTPQYLQVCYEEGVIVE